MSKMNKHIKAIDLIVLEISIYSLNDNIHRAKVTYQIEDYLQSVAEIIPEDYIVVCDNRNNTPSIVDSNALRYSIVTHIDGVFDIFQHQISADYYTGKFGVSSYG